VQPSSAFGGRIQHHRFAFKIATETLLLPIGGEREAGRLIADFQFRVRPCAILSPLSSPGLSMPDITTG